MIQNTMTFSEGERLSAHKLNELVSLINQQSQPTFATPNGMGFKGGARWQTNQIVMEQPANTPRQKPFDICPQWNANGELTAYVVLRPMWHDGSELKQLSADVVLSGNSITTAQHISLYELSSSVPTEVGTTDKKWRVMTENMESQYQPPNHPAIENKWMLYDVSNGLITRDYRDAFVQVGGGGGDGDIDLSGTTNSHHKGHEFKFKSMGNAKINVNVANDGTIQIGAYYV